MEEENRLTIEEIKRGDKILKIYKKVGIASAITATITTLIGIFGLGFSIINKGPSWAKVLELVTSLVFLFAGAGLFSFTSRSFLERKKLDDILSHERMHLKKKEISIK